jgi:diguanylate cyclase (GGDEF)-like protein
MPHLLPYAIPSLLGLAFSLSASLYVWRRHSGPTRPWTSALGVAVAWWCGGQLAWALTGDALWRRRVSQVQYFGITTSPVLWLMVALAYTGRRSWLVGWRWTAFFVMPAVTTTLVLTNDWHGLVWQRFESVAGRLTASVSYGPWFYIHTAYSYVVVLVASTLLALCFAASPLYRAQLGVVLLGPATILAANLLHITARSWLPIDPTPAGFAVGVGALAWALWRHGLFELLPVARGIALESLRDGILVLDDQRRVVDANPAARQLLAGAEVLGAPLARLLPEAADVDAGAERELRLPNGRRVELHVSAVGAPADVAEGHVVLLRDVTEAREAQDRLLLAQQQLRALNRELEQLAHTDALTGLANRRRLLSRLEEEWARARRHDRPVSLLLVDLDHFKRVNDTRGHLVGDRVIEATGRALAALVRPEDLPARHGGEELALLLPETDLSGACDVARRVRRALGGLRHVDDAGQPFSVTASVGVATLLARAGEPRDLLARADAALYHAKSSGRDGASRATETGSERFDPA